jgi:hypothetical protein
LGDSRWPFTLASKDALDYSPEWYRGAFEFLDRILVVPWNERLTSDHVGRMALAIGTSVDALIKEAA